MTSSLQSKEPYFDLTTGIVAAKTDAHHDFKSLYEESFVNAELPPHNGLPYVSEDTFLTTYTVDNVNDIKIPITAQTGQKLDSITSNILKEPLKNAYTVVAYRNKKSSEEEDDSTDNTGGSMLQKMITDLGIEDDIYIICDVAFSWIRYDLGKVDKEKEQIFWWTQTTQTGFDPAQKTGWHSGKELGFREPWSQGGARFCWQSITQTDKPNKLYVPWPTDKNIIGIENENAMLCLNKKLLMVAKSDNNKNWDPKTHTSFLLVYDAATKKYVYATKDMAAKNFEMSKGMISSYKELGAKLISMFKGILLGGNKLPKLETYTLQYQMLAKRCGDMPQALECLNKSMRLQTLVDPTKKPSANNVGIPPNFGNNRTVLYEGQEGIGGIFEGNGNNMFVSYDRIAIAQALNYRAPLVLYDQPFGVVLFVNNSLLSDSKKLLNALKQTEPTTSAGKMTYNVESTPLYFSYGTSKSMDFVLEKAQEFSSNLQLLTNGVEVVNNVKDELSNGLYGLPVTNDEELRAFLSAYFANLTKLELVNNMFQRMNELQEFIRRSNEEFSKIASSSQQSFLIEESQLNIALVQSSVNALFDEYSGIFEEVINTEGQLVERSEKSNASEFLSRLSTIVGYVINLINIVSTLKDQYETLTQLSTVESTVPKGIDGNIASITPSIVVDLRLTRHDPEQKVFGMAEKVFQHEKVITPIWTVVGKLDENVFPLADDFKIKMLGYVSAILANPKVSNAKMYSLVVKKAIADLNKLFASSVSQLGGSNNYDSDAESDNLEESILDVGSEEQFDAQQPSLVAQSSGPVKTDVLDLIEWANNGNYFFAEDQVFNALNFDVLLKNIFNILSFHYLRLKLDGKESSLFAFDLYQKIGSYLGIAEFESKEPELPAVASSSINDNLFLFNAMESQVYASDIQYVFNEQKYNFATLLYYYLNQRNNNGLVLFPEINNVVLAFGDTMNMLFDQLMAIDFSKFLGFIEMIVGQTQIQTGPRFEETKTERSIGDVPRDTLKRSRISPVSQRRGTIKRQRQATENEDEEMMGGRKASKAMNKKKAKSRTLKRKRKSQRKSIRIKKRKGKQTTNKKYRNGKKVRLGKSGKKRSSHNTITKRIK